MLSHSTALRSWSCPILSLHSPSVTCDEVRKEKPDGSQRPPTSLLLKTPSTHRDHTARLSIPGPCTSNIKWHLYSERIQTFLKSFDSILTCAPYQRAPAAIGSSSLCLPPDSEGSISASAQDPRSRCHSRVLPASQKAAHTTLTAAPLQAVESNINSINVPYDVTYKSYADVIYAHPRRAEEEPQRLKKTDVHGGRLYAEANVIGQGSSEIFLLIFIPSVEHMVRQNWSGMIQ